MAQRPSEGGELVETRHLTRRFGDRTAVADLTFSVAAGEIVALLGPNGAGKTTTLRMVAGLIQPSTGTVRVAGPVGLLTEAPGLWERLSVRLNLLTYARLHELPDPRARTEAALAGVGLSGRAGDAAGQLSKGLKQRAAIARTLIHDPLVVLLDEPTSGLDPASARQVRDLIMELRQNGRGVIVSTHNLAEAETLADRIAILRTGLLALDTPAALRARPGGTRVEVEVEGPAERWQAAADAAGASRIEPRGSKLTVTVPDAGAVPELVARLVADGARIMRVSPSRRSLEEVYLDLVGTHEEAV